MLTRRLALLGLAGLPLAGARPAGAQADFPNRPIRLIVPYAAGGAADLTARLLAQAMGERLGQPMVVDNRSGANGTVGADFVAHAPPDGYTLLIAPREVFGVNPALYPRLSYDPLRSFAYVGIVTTGPYVLVVNPELGAGSLAELVALARRQELSYASFGNGSMSHLHVEAMCRGFGLRMNHVVYRGAAPAVVAVLSGEVATTVATPPSVLGFIRQGRLRALAVGGERRLPQLPDVPTMTELGVAEDPLTPNFFGLAAPAGTPPAIVARLNAELRRAVAQPEMIERLDAAGLIPAGSTPEAMDEVVRRDVVRFGELIRTAGIRME